MCGDKPSREATSSTASAHPAGSRPPAFETTLMPRSRHMPMTCSIYPTKVRAYPPPGRLARVRARINIVSLASQSLVSTSIGPSSTISQAADLRSP